MDETLKPVIVVSKCLGFASCRYNGAIIADDFVQRLRPYVEFVPVCPEVEIGLGIPRDPVRVVQVEGARRLLQPATGKDVTEPMQALSQSFLDALPEVHGFILKGRFPDRQPCAIIDHRARRRRHERLGAAGRRRGAGLPGHQGPRF